MKDYIEARVKEVANYIIYTEATLRGAAKELHISKSTIYKDLVERLPKIDSIMAEETHSILEKNKAERHIRGGAATKNKFKGMM
ncbi:MAG: stage III sporulation protein D [Clostridium butyricum]|nr:stage III sporulation protein D [Clostridium butyricum]